MNLTRIEHGLRRRYKVTVPMLELMRPTGAWPWPCSLELAFSVFRWMVATGVGYRTQHRWHTSSVTSLLGGRSDDYAHAKGITSIRDLRERFQLALFADAGDEVERWLRDHGITAYAQIPMRFYHYDSEGLPENRRAPPHLGFSSEAQVKKALDELFNSAGSRTAVSLNCVHHDAKVVHGVQLIVEPKAFTWSLMYGFRAPDANGRTCDSQWRYTLARSQPDRACPTEPEPFLDTLRRALDKYTEIRDPANGHLTTQLVDEGFVPKERAPALAP